MKNPWKFNSFKFRTHVQPGQLLHATLVNAQHSRSIMKLLKRGRWGPGGGGGHIFGTPNPNMTTLVHIMPFWGPNQGTPYPQIGLEATSLHHPSNYCNQMLWMLWCFGSNNPQFTLSFIITLLGSPHSIVFVIWRRPL
jgi:hypothetical protein